MSAFSSQVESFEYLVSRDLEVLCDICQNRGECADSKRIVPWNRDVVFPADHRSQSQMAARLPRHLVSENAKRAGKPIARKVAR